MEGFRDCHCHLLPGVDDGVRELHETLKILERWKSLGVKEVWLTPHIMEDIPNNLILTEGGVFCFSGNMEHGIFYRDVRICRIYRDIVVKWRKIVRPFAKKIDIPIVLKIYDRFFATDEVRYGFIPGVCFKIIAEEGDYLESLVRLDIAGSAEIASSIITFAETYRQRITESGGKYRCITPKSMLRYALQEGYLGDFPREMTIPADQMRMLLRRYRRFSEINDIRLLDDDRFPESNTIGVDATPRYALISMSLPNEKEGRFFLIEEVSTAGLIYEYLKHLYEDKGITSRERNEWFEELIDE